MTTELIRMAIAFAGFAILAYWTFERFMGEREDPNIGYSAESDTGFMSVLFSGTKAVALVALVVVLALWGTSTGADPLLIAGLGVLLVVHWVVEKTGAWSMTQHVRQYRAESSLTGLYQAWIADPLGPKRPEGSQSPLWRDLLGYLVAAGAAIVTVFVLYAPISLVAADESLTATAWFIVTFVAAVWLTAPLGDWVAGHSRLREVR